MQKKRLSQVFLKDTSGVEELFEGMDLNGKTVLEIGAGHGAITRLYAKKAKRVIALEVDADLLPQLRENLEKFKNVEIVNADALHSDLSYPIVVGFLPYHLASPILFRILDSNFSEAILCLQEEMVLRLFAEPGSKNYSRLTVMTQSKADMEFLLQLPATAFKPVPKVDSGVVYVKKNHKFDLDSDFVSALFQHPNQNAKKALLHSITFLSVHRPHLTKEKLQVFCASNKDILTKSARQLTLEEFDALSKKFRAVE